MPSYTCDIFQILYTYVNKSNSDSKWYLTIVYASPHAYQRLDVWRELKELGVNLLLEILTRPFMMMRNKVVVVVLMLLENHFLSTL